MSESEQYSLSKIKRKTTDKLLNFAGGVTTRGLLGELRDSINMDESDIYLKTYIKAMEMSEYINELKEEDSNEWEILRNCKLCHWADSREKCDTQTFEQILREMVNNSRCVTDCMATVARYLYEELDEKMFKPGQKIC